MWTVPPLPLLHVLSGNVTFTNFTLAADQPYFNSYPFADGTTWAGSSGVVPSPGVWQLAWAVGCCKLGWGLQICHQCHRLCSEKQACMSSAPLTSPIASADCTGLFGVLLPPLIYVSGSTNTSTTNASLTLLNMEVVFNQCYNDVWERVVTNISAGPDVSRPDLPS